MKRFFLFWLLAFQCIVGQAASYVITATVTVTNTPANNDTIVVNAVTRTWKTSVTTPATQIAIGTGIGGNATNLYNHVAAYGFTGPLILARSSTNAITLKGAVDQALTLSSSGTWATITYATNTVTQSWAVTVPRDAYGTATLRTNIASEAVTLLSTDSTNSFTMGTAMQHFVDTASSQTLSNKTLSTGTYIKAGTITNTAAEQITFKYRSSSDIGVDGYNGIYFTKNAGGDPWIIAPDSAGKPSLYNANTTNPPVTPADFTPQPQNILNLLISSNTFGGKAYANSWTGTNEFTRITNSTIVGSALQYASQISGTITAITNGYWLSGGLTNASSTNTTLYLTNKVSGNWGYTRVNQTTMTSGNNAGVDFGDTAFAKITASTGAAATLCGIANGWNGRKLVVWNSTGYDMYISHNSGVEPTSSNRIYTPGSASITVSSPGSAEFLYDSESSKWLLINYR